MRNEFRQVERLRGMKCFPGGETPTTGLCSVLSLLRFQFDPFVAARCAGQHLQGRGHWPEIFILEVGDSTRVTPSLVPCSRQTRYEFESVPKIIIITQ